VADINPGLLAAVCLQNLEQQVDHRNDGEKFLKLVASAVPEARPAAKAKLARKYDEPTSSAGRNFFIFKPKKLIVLKGLELVKNIPCRFLDMSLLLRCCLIFSSAKIGFANNCRLWQARSVWPDGLRNDTNS